LRIAVKDLESNCDLPGRAATTTAKWLILRSTHPGMGVAKASMRSLDPHSRIKGANMNKTIATAFAAAIGLSGAAFADDRMGSFDTLDSNRDGAITRDEIPANHKLATEFSNIDSNGDGRISEAEFDAWKSNRAEQR
jgi:hypothetical protein